MAELAFKSYFDVFVAANLYPVSPSGKTAQKWVKNSSGGFAKMGWSPGGDVRGSYSVTTTSTDFTITGIIDVDGDGVYATYIATKSVNPNAPVSDSSIY